MLVASRVVFLLILYPAYAASPRQTRPPTTIVAVNMVLNFVFAIGIGAMYAFLAEAFPAAVRSSGLGFSMRSA